MLAKFFESNIVLVYFIYPLIFFLMGFGILLKNTVHSRFYEACKEILTINRQGQD
ncbi:hypothetical protein JCM15765_30310 [Paradesulfitobacterium aromaticivorans]